MSIRSLRVSIHEYEYNSFTVVSQLFDCPCGGGFFRGLTEQAMSDCDPDLTLIFSYCIFLGNLNDTL